MIMIIIMFSIYITQINIQEDMIKCALQSNAETNIPNEFTKRSQGVELGAT